jgi:hypothetical protein
MNSQNTSSKGSGARTNNNLTFVYFQRPGDKERIQSSYNDYMKCSLEELIATYNKAQNLGFVGVHAQGLAMIALHFCFLKVFGKSPFSFEEHTLLDFTGKIELYGSNWTYVE